MQKDANLVELAKCCRTHIFLQKFVFIQPRTSPPKICKILQNFKIAKFADFANPDPLTLDEPAEAARRFTGAGDGGSASAASAAGASGSGASGSGAGSFFRLYLGSL